MRDLLVLLQIVRSCSVPLASGQVSSRKSPALGSDVATR